MCSSDLNVSNNIHNTAPVDDEEHAKDGFIKQYDVAATKDHVVLISNHLRVIRRQFPDRCIDLLVNDESLDMGTTVLCN